MHPSDYPPLNGREVAASETEVDVLFGRLRGPIAARDRLAQYLRAQAARVSFLEAAVEREVRARHYKTTKHVSGPIPTTHGTGYRSGAMTACGCRLWVGGWLDDAGHASHVALEVAKALGGGTE